MTIRSLILGLLLALGVAATTYFNDFVIRQTSLIGHLLPLSVFGFAAFVLLVVNPVLGRLRPGFALRPAELGVVALMGLAACTWPGAGLFRTSTPILSMPGYRYAAEPAWRAGELNAYVPDGSPRIAPGQVDDWGALARSLAEEPSLPLDQTLRSGLDAAVAAGTAERGVVLSSDQEKAVLAALNEMIEYRALSPGVEAGAPGQALPLDHQRMNRRWLTEHLSGLASPPGGRGLLLAGGRNDPGAMDPLIGGGPGDEAFARVDWPAWWPVIRFWSVLVLLLGGASLCLALIVHRQWSGRELLAYPIPRFFEEIAERSPGRLLPDVCRSRLFVLGLIAMIVLHLCNGLAAWFDGMIELPLTLNLLALRRLFPTAGQVPAFGSFLWGWLFPTVIAFTLFLDRRVSLSLGVAPLVFTVFASVLLTAGISVDNEYLGAGIGNMLRFGAYVGCGLLIAYTGRTYYLAVARSAVTVGAQADVPGYARWSARLLVVMVAGAVVWINQCLELDWLLSAAVVGLVLLIFLVLARITAETGMFFIQPNWMPVAALTALFGFDAIGPTAYLTLAILSTMLVGDPRTALACNLVNGLRINERAGGPSPGRAAWPVGLVIVAGFLVAGLATLWVQHTYGIMNTDGFTREALPRMPFDQLAGLSLDAAGRGTLAASNQVHGLERLGALSVEPGTLGWLGLGLGLFLVVAALRLRLSWWPLHPVIFLVWGTYPSNRFAFSILIGWAIKSATMHLGGVRAFRAAIPLAVGVIAGEMLMGLGWIVVGVIYYLATGHPPARYNIF